MLCVTETLIIVADFEKKTLHEDHPILCCTCRRFSAAAKACTFRDSLATKSEVVAWRCVVY